MKCADIRKSFVVSETVEEIIEDIKGRPMSSFLHTDFDRFAKFIKDKRVSLVCSGPGCLDNDGEFIDSFDIVARVNNYKMRGFESKVGSRTDLFCSFFGSSIKKSRGELLEDGVRMCIAKCPDAILPETKQFNHAWHRRKNKMLGVDFRYIYQMRSKFWFCETYLPTVDEFMSDVATLGYHIPTTGFWSLMQILKAKPSHLFVTGFDGFRSGIHNVNERWNEKNKGLDPDPYGHDPERELLMIRDGDISKRGTQVSFDKKLTEALE